MDRNAAGSRRWFRFGTRGLLALVALAALAAWLLRPRPFPDPTKPIKYVDVVLDNGKSDPLHVAIDDKQVIRTAIVDPFNEAKRDPAPAAFVVAGGMHVYYEDGTADSAAVFLPWGHWKYGKSYYIADLSLLEIEVRSRLRKQGSRGVGLADDTEFWDPYTYNSGMPAYAHP